jgi:hypothetical protein
VLECIDGAGNALSPMIIFKAQNTNSAWIPQDTPSSWQFSTSASGWTSNSHGYEWLRKIFMPESLQKSGGQPRLLVMDGHSSHITGNVIALCMENDVDLLILPPHCSHLLQPLDVGVYGPLKKYHAQEVDRYSRVGIHRIQRVEWIKIFQRIREKALTHENIRSGWRGSGLFPYHPQRVLNSIPVPSLNRAHTPQIPVNPEDLDLSVLQSSPPDGTELLHANVVFNTALANNQVPESPTRRYAKRVTRLVESQNAELTLLRKELQECKDMLQTRKKQTTGKRIKLQGEFVFSTEEVLKIVREAEEKQQIKRPRGRPRKRPIEELDEEEEEEEVEDSPSESELEVIECVVHKRRPKPGN